MYDSIPQYSLVAQRPQMDESHKSPLYSLLWEQKEFREAVKNLYKSTILPELERMLSTDLPETSNRIAAASRINHLRWYGSETISDHTADIEAFLRDRIFLNSSWLDEVSYHTVILKWTPDAKWLYLQLEETEGNKLPNPSDYGVDSDCWYLEESGKRFDQNLPITDGMVLTAYDPMQYDSAGEEGR